MSNIKRQPARGLRTRRLALSAAILTLGGASGGAMAQVVLKPTVDRFEAVATDAAIGANSTIANNWGGHQPRITVHADGTVRVLYLSPRADGTLTWKLRMRMPTAVWQDEASGQTTDDVALLRDPRDDRAYVFAYPGSVPYVYTGPTYTPFKVPGNWQVLPASARHYGNAGIASDGTVCLKASHEFSNAVPVTTGTNMDYNCGYYTASTSIWSWGIMASKPVGQRHAYDFIFPATRGSAVTMYSFAQRDAHKLAENLPNLTPETYVFDGARAFTGQANDLSGNASLVSAQMPITDAVPRLPFASQTITAAPTERMQDSYMDSKGRVFTLYALDDPLNPTVRTRNIVVTSPDGRLITTILGAPVLPAPGATRIVEDSKNRLWLLWNLAGGKSTQVIVYPLTETVNADGSSSFKIGPGTDISAPFYPYVLDGPMYVASVRAGNTRGVYVNAVFNACTITYTANVNINISACYNSDKSGLQRVFYARIRLPD